MRAQYSKEPVDATSARRRFEWTGRAGRSERGAALLLALLVVALLMTLVLEFDRSVRLEHRAAGNYRDATAAFYLAKAGLAEGRALLLADQSAGSTDSLDEVWAEPGETPLGRGVTRVSVVDEERFFPINSLITGNTPNATRVTQFQRLLRSLQIDDRLADAVMDWIDQGDDARPDGAESSYYGSLPKPYRAHNGPMDSLEELRLVRGVTNEIYARLSPHLTAAQPGNIQINLNTADRVVLGALDAELTPELIDRVIAERPIESAADLDAILGQNLSSRVRGFGASGLVSATFTIQSEGIVNDITRVVTMQVRRSALEMKPLWVRTES